MRISGIWIYPVKSLRGIALDEAYAEPRGLQYDRRWMLVDERGEMITQRQVHDLALLTVELQGACLCLGHQDPGYGKVSMPIAVANGERIPVVVWGDTVMALWPGLEADAWLSDAIGLNCRLVYMDDEAERYADQRYAGAGKMVSFADGYPYLLVNQASLDDLSRRAGQPFEPERFRPNVLVEGAAAFAEDAWRSIRIGDLYFDLVKACARCVVITLDPKTGHKGVEPLRTLSGFRQKEGKVLFGTNMLVQNAGPLRLGMALELEERRSL